MRQSDSQKVRWIAHVDMDSFYVSVERLKNPKLLGRPVVVGGLGPRSVVASASYEARKFGVRSAMPMAQARRLCRSLIAVAPDFSSYSRISKSIFTELQKIAPVVEQVSVDEAYLDFTGCERLYSSREASARAVKEAVKKISGLTATVGVSSNKLVAKIASDAAKPDGLLVVPAGGEAEFLRPMSIRKIPGVGPKTALIFERHGLLTCGDLAAQDAARLASVYGEHAGELWERARGIHDSPVDPGGIRKSISSEETFERDIGDMEVLVKYVAEMAEDLATGLREESLAARTVGIKIRYGNFTTLVRAHTIDVPTYLSKEIASWAVHLLKTHRDPSLKLRLLGVSVRNLVPLEKSPSRQMDLFEDPTRRIKEEKLEFVKDALKKKFGKNILKNS